MNTPKPQKKPQAILFDLDGTLIDSAPDLAATLNALLAEEQRPALPFAQIRPEISYGVNHFLQLAFPDSDEAQRHVLRERYLAIYQERLCDNTTYFTDIESLLIQLNQQSTRLGIVTNKHTHYAQPIVAHLGLDVLVDAIVCGDTLPVAKPDPSPLFLVCAMLGVEPSQCIYVGDSTIDIRAGRAAGMTTIACAYGYIGSDLPIDEWQADHVAEQPADLIRLLVYTD